MYNQHIQKHIQMLRDAKLNPEGLQTVYWLIGVLEQQQREIAMLQQQNSDMKEALGCIANYCHLGESFHTSITRCMKIAAAALSPEEDQTPPTDYKRLYEALIQSIKDGLGEFPPAKSAESLVAWIESTCPFVGDLREVSKDVQDDR